MLLLDIIVGRAQPNSLRRRNLRSFYTEYQAHMVRTASKTVFRGAMKSTFVNVIGRNKTVLRTSAALDVVWTVGGISTATYFDTRN